MINLTVFASFAVSAMVSALLLLVRRVVALTRRDQRNVDVFISRFPDRPASISLSSFSGISRRRAPGIPACSARRGFRCGSARRCVIDSGQLEHVPQLAGEGYRLVVPVRRVVDVDVFVALLQFLDFVDRFFQLVVVADDRHVVRHPFAQLFVQHDRRFRCRPSSGCSRTSPSCFFSSRSNTVEETSSADFSSR